MVEFIVVLMPLLTAFFCGIQIAFLGAAKMVAQHAVSVGVRAAAVHAIMQPEGVSGAHVAAVDRALGPWSNALSINTALQTSGAGPSDEIRLQGTATYTCHVALARRIVCTGGTQTWETQATLTNHGAAYQ
ncbi:MAG: hypothetical protein KBF88_04080 [Polyangiaceae bacterium]|nr:hypothetical protein [Polyangiaceae bacterium]